MILGTLVTLSHLSEYPAPFHIMWPRMNNQKILYPLCAHRNSRYDFKPLRSLSGADLMGGKRIFEAIGGGEDLFKECSNMSTTMIVYTSILLFYYVPYSYSKTPAYAKKRYFNQRLMT